MTAAERDAVFTADDAVLTRACVLQFTKGTGNGGQKRNKTSSAVRLTHEPTGLTAYASDSRSQVENRKIALKRLRLSIAMRVRPSDAASAFQPEPVPSVSNCALYAFWLARLFDLLSEYGWDMRNAAERAGISRSKLEKLLRRDDAAFRFYQEKHAAAVPAAAHESE